MFNLDSLFQSYIEVMDVRRTETSNCVLVAHVLHEVLLGNDIENEVCIGYAVWSVGKGNNDIITHIPNPSIPIENAVDIHAWIEISEGRKILDFTTYQLKKKARLLQEADGLKTNVLWCPNYLFTTQDKLKSLNEIKRSKFAGKYGYQRDSKLEEIVKEKKDTASINQVIETAIQILKLNKNDFLE